MKWLVWSIRAWFCKHEWDYDEQMKSVFHFDYDFTEKTLMVSQTCKNCGWHRKYKKF